MEEDAEVDEDEEVLLHIPGSFDVEDHGGGVARGTGAGTVDPFDAVGLLLVCSGICGGGCAAEMIVRTKIPYALYFPPSRPSILSTFAVMVTFRSTTPVVFGGEFPLFGFIVQSDFMARCPLVYVVSATLTI